MLSPIITVYKHFPLQFFVTIFLMAVVAVCLLLHLRRLLSEERLSRVEAVCSWLLAVCAMGILFFTVLGRRSWDVYRYNFDMGYSYRALLYGGDAELVRQVLVNIAAFVPVGAFGFFAFRRLRVLASLLCGVGLSALIELLQLVLRRGCCEIDDIMGNLFGTLAGIAAAGAVSVTLRLIIRRNGQT